MPSLTLGWVFTLVLGVSASGCLDFDQYGEGTGGSGGSGGADAGGSAQGGGAGGTPTCPSDPVVPTTVCVTGAPYTFDGMLGADWAFTELGTVALGCGGTCAATTLGQGRLDLRTMETATVDSCFASIDILSSDAERTFLELIPDGDTGTGAIPLPDRANNIEVAVAGNNVRFEIGELALPALTLDGAVMVDQLRIQVRADTVVLEAFAGGQQVACTEQERPELLNGAVRAGFGIQGTAGQEATFDAYGALGD